MSIVRILRGDPTPEEVAAITVVLLARAGAVSAGAGSAGAGSAGAVSAGAVQGRDRGATGGWSDPATRFSATVRPGPGAWRASAR